MQAKYAFLYSNYSPRHPYWETTEMLRKFAIAFIPVRVWVGVQRAKSVFFLLRKLGIAFMPVRGLCVCCAWGGTWPVQPLCSAWNLLPVRPAPARQAAGTCTGRSSWRDCAPTSPQVFIPTQVEGSVQAACAQVGAGAAAAAWDRWGAAGARLGPLAQNGRAHVSLCT